MNAAIEAPDERASGFALDLRGDVELMATYVPGRKKPYLGLKQGNQFVALAQFLSGRDMRFLKEVLAARLFVIQPLEEIDAPKKENGL